MNDFWEAILEKKLRFFLQPYMSFKVGPIFVHLVLVRQLASKEYLPDFLFLRLTFELLVSVQWIKFIREYNSHSFL